ncbi:hypothetical protein BAX99_13100 [Elizabethkingia miricola]|nr:hypothetical protein BAX99_13100 [Elizabethkingia miricola]
MYGYAPHRLHLTFYQTGCDIIAWDIHYPIFGTGGYFFSFHIIDQRKEAKERRLDILAFLLMMLMTF